jgi:hypothetical protein
MGERLTSLPFSFGVGGTSIASSNRRAASKPQERRERRHPFITSRSQRCSKRNRNERIPAMSDIAIALLLSQQDTHNARQDQLAAIAKLEEENAKLRAAKKAAEPPKAKKSKAPIHKVQESKGMLRQPTVETATEFMAATRTAGKRVNDKGLPYTAPLEVRGDLIKAIDAFVGYEATGNFGSQELNARTLASRILSGNKVDSGPTREEQHRASRSLAGFVAGLPDNMAKQLANLRAQVERVTEALIECEKVGNTVGATVERERLNGESGLYAQIKALGFDH